MSLRPLFAVGALAVLAACSNPSARADYDAGVPFPVYRTFDWQLDAGGEGRAGGPEAFDNPIMDGRVKRAVETELAAKGFSRRQAWADPDFLVAYHPQDEGTRSQHVRLGLGFRVGPLGIGVGAPLGDPRPQAVAAIVLEIEDFRSRAVVWKAVAPGALQEADSPEEAEAGVTEAVHTLFLRLPPPGR